MKWLAVVMALAMMVPAPHAWASMRGEWLKKTCKEPALSFAKGLCDGYVAGVADANQVYELKDGQLLPKLAADGSIEGAHLELRWCLPTGSTGPQLVKVVKKWLAQHPEELREQAAAVIAKALQQAFPCKGD
ncbi:MAG TPA: hypothetical protein DEP35_01330 [Deltaproteobacteria bacterium]|jgi:hypothetical protein|nr:hypothetical protein [Deltaproteobacteria bacterium]